MRAKLTLAVMLLVLVIPAMSQETPPASACCQNTVTGQVLPRMMHTCAELGAGWVDSAAPCVPVETEPSWWDALVSWADGQVIYHPDAGTAAKILAWLVAFMGVVQTLKKAMEGSGPLAWLLKLLPKNIREFLAHNLGPVVLNVIITGSTLLIAAFKSADGVTVGALLRIVAAVGGVDLVYKLLRGFSLFGFSFSGLFPKTTA